ncbi:hypothetical protein GPECTOR_43g913 [Gonium pectorale]|uniref:FAD-binding FR-type domain-containing protein n=1 Tax=Gonium pectorale TaxID=33097 RepID=A0A150G9F1_GONPE|nr:hypothetical protein GPECTOR_43g913 [Gonium pectorale]|eukprot:KXZ46477.1 hypothetical protein GPECTOR_43g913 [Gonium pectorale]
MGRASVVSVRAGPVQIDEEDLIQGKDRHKWYETKFAAEDQPAWNIGRFLHSQQVSPEFRAVTVECEVSRERVPLRSAFKAAGQRAALRVNNSQERRCAVASAPFPEDMNIEPLFKVRGDLFAHEIKSAREPISIKAELTVLVNRKEAPEVYHMGPDDVVEVGPFVGTGLALRSSPLMAMYACPTVVMFVSGRGIATARSLLESTPDVLNLTLAFRRDVRVYYKAPNAASLVFRERFEDWESRGPVKVLTTTSSFQDAFDDDDSLMYDPATTGAIVLTGGDEEEDKAAREVCKEAEIFKILSDLVEAEPTTFLSSNPFEDWMTGNGKPTSRRGRGKGQQQQGPAAPEQGAEGAGAPSTPAATAQPAGDAARA